MMEASLGSERSSYPPNRGDEIQYVSSVELVPVLPDIVPVLEVAVFPSMSLEKFIGIPPKKVPYS